MLKKSGRTLIAVLLATGISISLSSCLVKKESPASVQAFVSTTNTLHIYADGEFIDYTITAIDSTSGNTTRGILRVKWEQAADLIDPIDTTTTYPVLKETTTLTNNGETIPAATVVRYISQVNTSPASIDQGSIILRAISDGTDFYWPYDPSKAAIPNSPVTAPVIFDSPVVFGSPAHSPVNFSAMEGCGNGTCGTAIYTFNDDSTVDGSSTEITTNYGRFSNPFKISYSGTNVPQGASAVSVLGDIRHACGDSSNNISHSGNMFVMPEVGIIQMTNTCRLNDGSGTTVFYTVTLSNTNISIP